MTAEMKQCVKSIVRQQSLRTKQLCQVSSARNISNDEIPCEPASRKHGHTNDGIKQVLY